MSSLSAFIVLIVTRAQAVPLPANEPGRFDKEV